MRRLIVLEIFDYDYTYRYGFKNLQDLSNFLSNLDYNDIEIEYYIYADWLNQDKINRLNIKIIER